ncbi:hypothetical protein BARBAKC583_0207 [Bartonella bacilliformis KC583]|uniref:Uncharacterized protein n=1 Tax=Bartonella bacilliformis (strain ATCC 35685 / KC583 / Herrer 020/F12,63) TaxID=360095 RepID=A1URE0_BARBK|nr:hypothetical protein BARBAKC583_0207 [Bartonella bacilliformis KC583]
MLIPPFLAFLFLPLFDSPSALLLKPLSFPAPCQLPLSFSPTRPLFISFLASHSFSASSSPLASPPSLAYFLLLPWLLRHP